MRKVVCFGGPHDGKTQMVGDERKGWELWRPVIEREPLKWREENEEGPQPPRYGREYVGSYVIEGETGRANWIQAYRGTL